MLSCKWSDVCRILGYPLTVDEDGGFNSDDGWVVHQGETASGVEVLDPLYIPGWGVCGQSANLLPVYDIMLRVYQNTIAPKCGNFDQIHSWCIDLMF